MLLLAVSGILIMNDVGLTDVQRGLKGVKYIGKSLTGIKIWIVKLEELKHDKGIPIAKSQSSGFNFFEPQGNTAKLPA